MKREASSTTRSGALGLLAGLAASLCCLGPSAAVLLGLGSSSALAGLAFDRTLALTVGGGLLAAGLVLAHRHARSCELQRARWRQPALLLLSFVITYGLLGYLLPQLAARQASSVALAAALAPDQPANMATRRATLNVEKMICPPCAAHVRSTLARKPYVRSYSAETNNELVTIDYDSRQASVREIMALFPRAYGITMLSDETLP